jgi:hypothetical protein
MGPKQRRIEELERTVERNLERIDEVRIEKSRMADKYEKKIKELKNEIHRKECIICDKDLLVDKLTNAKDVLKSYVIAMRSKMMAIQGMASITMVEFERVQDRINNDLERIEKNAHNYCDEKVTSRAFPV